MKTKIIICIVIVVALVTVAWIVPSSDQISVKGVKQARPVDPVFNFMHAHRQGKGATIDWHTNATPATVACFEVMRTYEDPNDPYAEWAQVGKYNCTSSRSYKCTENNVSPGFIRYCVIASMIGGGSVISEVETIHIVQH